MVFYLKYRPKTLEELDNTHVASLMVKYLARESIPHAFLFTGPKGTGKTSTARILAKSINCREVKVKGQACGKCDICTSIARGDNLDILEIDAASNRGIDEIRDLREKIKLTPIGLSYKVYIIDEVHMLTSEAFNALLKTLEEPPAHAIFILATTEPHKVPETITSRCIHIEFHKAGLDEVMHSLERIVKQEKLDIEKEALMEIAKHADGSFRDAHKLLEELTLQETKVTSIKVKQYLGLSDKALEEEFLSQLKQKKAKEMLEIIKNLAKEGKNMRQFFLNLLHKLESLLIDHYSGKESDWKKEELAKALEIFSRSFAELKTAVIPSLPFELAIVEYTETALQKANPSDSEIVNVGLPMTSSDPVSVQPITEKWDKLLETIKPVNHSIVGVLRSCRPLSLEGDELTIEAAFKFHAERLAEAKIRELIAKAIKDVVGLNVSIKTVLKNRL